MEFLHRIDHLIELQPTTNYPKEPVEIAGESSLSYPGSLKTTQETDKHTKVSFEISVIILLVLGILLVMGISANIMERISTSDRLNEYTPANEGSPINELNASVSKQQLQMKLALVQRDNGKHIKNERRTMNDKSQHLFTEYQRKNII